MANIKHLTSALRLTLSLGTVDGKSVTKTVSISKLGASAGAAGDEVLLEEIEETVGEEEQKYREAELREMLFRALNPDELDLTQALIEGFTQQEIARELGISQQAVAARLRKIRAKLKELIAEL